jgi:L-alanine-DL-glutamate epimerase-like enolase superfamily enzyme
MIKRIDIIEGSIPLTKTNPEQLWVSEWSNQIFVKIQTEQFEGWGEVLPAAGNIREPYVALMNRLREYLLGRDENDIATLWDFMRKMTFTGGYGITTGAISGIDIALWDVLGKKMSLPVCKLLGSVSSVRRYVSLSRYRNIDDLRIVCGKLLAAGYTSIKLHQPPEDTLDSVKAVRNEFGYGFKLMVDLNCGFNYNMAQEFMKKVQRYDLKWIEEPLWPPDDFKSLKKLNEIGPVAAGENFFSLFEFKQLLEDDSLTYYQPDVTKVGGVTPMIKILKLFEQYRAKVAFHNRPHNGWVGIIASAHLASAAKVDCVIETPPNEIPNEYFHFNVKIQKNTLEVGGPGIGITPREPIPQATNSKLLKFHNI